VSSRKREEKKMEVMVRVRKNDLERERSDSWSCG